MSEPGRGSTALGVALAVLATDAVLGATYALNPYTLFTYVAPACGGLAVLGLAAAPLAWREWRSGRPRGPAVWGAVLGLLAAGVAAWIGWATGQFFWYGGP